MSSVNLRFFFEIISSELERIDTSDPDSKLVLNLSPTDQSIVLIAGLDSETLIDKVQFERYLKCRIKKGDKIPFLKSLIQNDISSILDTLKNTLLESIDLYYHFEELLDSTNLLVNNNDCGNKVIISKTPKTSLIIGLLSSSIIKMMSSLDIVVKYCYALEEKENFNYSKYHKINNKILFGDAKHLKKIKGVTESISNVSNDIRLLENLRNDFIHNNSINSFNRIYVKIFNNKVIDKYILIPDSQDGHFLKSTNRNRFFSNENKLNEFVPNVYEEVLKKVINTLKQY
ncbi:hypothetical protein LVD15_10165 [Fulvivirga maritima]|uniref:hypothetical protein n=1 Tax=Fulvivirga maritima TaxID=2904247 RepID=UPI001F321A4D|nr:hypothetical protein [Fulvivirga maritima]UII28766.1 hypothetical protein LVD15_10165 [Fulvivirga maritima]